MLTAHIETSKKTKTLVIRVSLQKPVVSSTGRSMIVATSDDGQNRGFAKTDCIVDGQPIQIVLKAYVPMRQLQKSGATW